MLYVTERWYGDDCWWCGQNANSREHKYKRTEIKRTFGDGPYRGDTAPVRVYDSEMYAVQGPRSNQLLFEKSLCSDCNSSRSQPFDRSYDQFIGFLDQNRQQLLILQEIDWAEVYGTNWRKTSLELLKYFVKHACCRLVESNLQIDSEVRESLDSSAAPKKFAFEFSINQRVAELREELGGSLWIGDMTSVQHGESKEYRRISSHYGSGEFWTT